MASSTTPCIPRCSLAAEVVPHLLMHAAPPALGIFHALGSDECFNTELCAEGAGAPPQAPWVLRRLSLSPAPGLVPQRNLPARCLCCHGGLGGPRAGLAATDAPVPAAGSPSQGSHARAV